MRKNTSASYQCCCRLLVIGHEVKAEKINVMDQYRIAKIRENKKADNSDVEEEGSAFEKFPPQDGQGIGV